MNNVPNLATDADAIARYDEEGSWGRMSEGWPSTEYNTAKWLLCTKAEVVPYGQYVVADGRIRVATEELKAKLEKVFEGMFVECRNILLQYMEGKAKVCDCGETMPTDYGAQRDKETKPTAADVLRFLDYFAGQEDTAEDVRDFVQNAARMIDEGKSLYDFGMSGLASFVEWYWENSPETFEEAWAKKEAEGYQYGRDALENVRFGWNIAKGLE